MDDAPTQVTAHKAYAAAVVAILVYVLNGFITGEWASVESIAPALTVVLAPFAVYIVPNNPKGQP